MADIVEHVVVAGVLITILGVIVLRQQLRRRRSSFRRPIIVTKKEAALEPLQDMTAYTRLEDERVEESHGAADDTALIPELEDLLNRTREDLEPTSADQLKEAMGPVESTVGKIQRRFEEIQENAESQSTEPEEAMSLGGENEVVVDMMRKLEWAYQQLYARDADVWRLRQQGNHLRPRRETREQGLQHTPNEQGKSTEMVKTESVTDSSLGGHSGKSDRSGAVSVLGTDTEAVSSGAEEGMEDLGSRSSDFSEWLPIEGERMRVREPNWSKLRKSNLRTENAPGQPTEEGQGLRDKMNKIQESRDRIWERLEATEARLGDAQKGLEKKDAEITALRASLASARAESKATGKMRENTDDDAESFDESITSGNTKGTESVYSSRRSTREGKSLSDLVKGTGLLGKALSFRHQSSLRKRKIPAYAQEAVMKFGSSSDVSSRASMSSG